MEIYIQHKGQETGPFSPQEILAGVASGLYQTTDLVWYQGAQGWIPLSAAPQISASPPPLPLPGKPQNSGLAITSMVLGFFSFLCGIPAIPAVICGHIALGKIKRSQGQLTGGGFAIAGLVMGYVGLVVLLVAALAGFTAPMIIRQRKKADQVEAISNARSFGVALSEFQVEYGRFPDASTAALVAKKTETSEITGSSSNARFRQLLLAGISQSETAFYVKTAVSHKPDGIISGDQAIAPGECGFGYVENLRTDDGKSRPLAMAPFKPVSTKFDPMPFDAKAVILWSDNSVTSLPIDRATGAAIFDGKNLLDPTHPVWGGVPPSLLLPE